MSFKWPSKSPTETLDFNIDWSRLIDVTLSSATYTIEYDNQPALSFGSGQTVYGLTHTTSSISGRVTTIYLSAGVLNRNYKLVCQVTDSLGRVTERSVNITIRER
jgi:hypothetical protein